MSRYTIGSVHSCLEDSWQVVGFACMGDGIQVWGNYISGSMSDGRPIIGMQKTEWTEGFNRNESEVWKQIKDLPISYEAKKELGETGVYPQHLMHVVGLQHDNWRKSIGTNPNSWTWSMVGAPKGLKTPCPFSE